MAAEAQLCKCRSVEVVEVVLAHHLFTTFISTTGVWRAQGKIRCTFVDVLQAMTGLIHDTSDKKCIVNSMARRYRGSRLNGF